MIADTSTDTGENVQRGFMDMFAGAAAALRNPKAHENDFITAENAARQLMFASMLMYELDEALEREENSTIAAIEKFNWLLIRISQATDTEEDNGWITVY